MMTMPPDGDAPSAAASSPAIGVEDQAASAAQKLSSQDLFRHGSTVCIEHQGEHYWLRLTRGNKLILTK
jgi:hemin uptake protein HemP